jgi:ParB/Sulfiredoxin domain
MINLFHSRRIFTPHEIAMTFPPLSDEELQELVRDIAQHGQREPITLFGKKILDGWHRYRACRQIGVTPFYREFEGDLKAAVAYARSANAIRRHLTTEQRREAAELMRKLVAELIKAEPTTSDRQIAAQAGSTHPTVAKVRAELEQSGDMESFPYREDSIGRRRKRPTLA